MSQHVARDAFPCGVARALPTYSWLTLISTIKPRLLEHHLGFVPHPTCPITPPLLDVRQSSPSRTGGDLIFNIAFSLALLLALLGSFAWLATGRTIAQLMEGFDRMYAAAVAVSERLSDFQFSSLVEKAAAAILDTTGADTANTPPRGGMSYPMATVPGDRLQRGGNPPALAQFT
ncbi:hypothetical protein EI94DRAFT_1727883 [Lactarius quietus]|nr:hypothetical protein EI94DRAFT_1727883 [Lactarius quietus]